MIDKGENRMNCPNCHKHLDGQTNFCVYCGAPLGAASGTKMPKRKKRILWTAVGLVCAVIVALGGCMIARHIRSQRVTPEMLNHLVSTTDNTAQLVEDYFDLYFSERGREPEIEDESDLYNEIERHSDFLTDLKLAEGKILRENSYLVWYYRNYSRRNGWDPDKYEDYEALYEACCALIDFVDSYDYNDPDSTRETYDSLMKTYQKCLDRVT